jgi:hypothetical protein
MTDPLPSLDLRLTPDWLKEPETGNRYADYEGDDRPDSQHRARRDRREDRPRRSGRPSDRPRQDRSDRRTSSSAKSAEASSRAAAPSESATPAAGRSPSANRGPASGSGGQRSFRGDRPRYERQEADSSHAEVEPAPVQIDFLPEERAFTKIIQQIKQGHIAYPLFGLARMFLERPERHRIRIRSLDNHTLIYQFSDDGPVAMDASALERIAFNAKKDEFYETRIVEKEPIKGNFTSVARCTFSGKLLGPSNYHAFQPALRGLYEQRFSRRMSFEDYRRSIEISSDPKLVEQWKEEARTSVAFQTKDPENPTSFENLAAVEQHFRANYLPSLIRGCLATEISGEMARHLPDRGIVAAIRKARDRENRFPAQIAGALRHGLNQAGLHVFKHKKRILYISTVRPQLFDSNQGSVSAGLSAILSTVKSYPKISRKQLAEKVLSKVIGAKSADESNEVYQQARTALATNLIWLAKAGHVIEFADGTLDLPLPPRQIDSGKSAPAASASPDAPRQSAGGSTIEQPSVTYGESEDPAASGPSKKTEEATGAAHLESSEIPAGPEPAANPTSGIQEPMPQAEAMPQPEPQPEHRSEPESELEAPQESSELEIEAAPVPEELPATSEELVVGTREG